MRNLREVLDQPAPRSSRRAPTHRETVVVPSARSAPGVAADFKVDERRPIGPKWNEAGGAAKLGAPTSEMKSALAGQLRYQSFEKGAIFFTETFGAMLVDSALFAKWSRLGSTLQNQLGPPIADSKSVFFGRGGSVRVATFQKGAIAARGRAAFEVHGRIYERWRALNDVTRPARLADLRRGDRGRAAAGVHASPAATSTGRAAPTLPPRSRARSATSGKRSAVPRDCSATRSPTRRP